MRHVRLAVTVALIAGAGFTAAHAATATHHDYPVPYTFAAGITADMTTPGAPPPGANDWTCKPSAVHPEPVVLVHGLAANMTVNWQTISPLLADAGYCVFALTYGTEPNNPQMGGMRPMEQSAAVLGAFVQRVLRATGAAKVDIVGHSEGATMPDYYVKFLGGARYVDHYVGIAPVLHGTQFYGLGALAKADPAFAQALTGGWCQSCTEFLQGSAFINKLDAGGAAVPGVVYTLIVTRNDELVTPYTSGELHGWNSTNFVVQDQCAVDQSDHISVVSDPVTAGLVLNALDPAHRTPPVCEPVAPVVG